jgi:hypothetical protein
MQRKVVGQIGVSQVGHAGLSKAGIIGMRPLLVNYHVELGIMEQARAQLAEILRQSGHYTLAKGGFGGAPSSSSWVSDLRRAGLTMIG